MSNPAPLSRTKYVRGLSPVAPISIRASLRLPVNFQALPIRFSKTIVNNRSSRVGNEPIGNDQLDLAVGRCPAQAFGNAADNRTHVGLGALKFAAGDARQRQQVIDQKRHVLRSFTDVPQMLLAIIIEFFAAIFQQGQAEAVDTAQRRTKIVRDGIAEGFEFLVLQLEFFGEFGTRLGCLERGAGFNGGMLCPK